MPVGDGGEQPVTARGPQRRPLLRDVLLALIGSFAWFAGMVFARAQWHDLRCLALDEAARSAAWGGWFPPHLVCLDAQGAVLVRDYSDSFWVPAIVVPILAAIALVGWRWRRRNADGPDATGPNASRPASELPDASGSPQEPVAYWHRAGVVGAAPPVPWVAHWLLVTSVGTWVFASLYFLLSAATSPGAVEQGVLLTVMSLVWFPVLALFAMMPTLVLPMTAVAGALRWLWRRAAPHAWRDATAAAVAGGLVSGPIAVIGFELFRLVLRGRRALEDATLTSLWWSDFPFTAPLLLGGAAAGYLAHHAIPVTSARWWAIVVGAAAVGLVLVVPLDPSLQFAR